MNKNGNMIDFLNHFNELYEKERGLIDEEFSNLKYDKLSVQRIIRGSFKGKKKTWQFVLRKIPPNNKIYGSIQKSDIYLEFCNKFNKKYTFSQKIENIKIKAQESRYETDSVREIFSDFVVSDFAYQKFKEQYILFMEDAKRKENNGTLDKIRQEMSVKRQRNGAILKLKNKITESYKKGVSLEEVIKLAKELNIKFIHEQ